MGPTDRDAAHGDIQSGIAGRLRASIRSGAYEPGQHLPSLKELADTEGVAPLTARAAMLQLIGEGLVVAVPRKGYYVREIRPLKWHMNKIQDPKRLKEVQLDAWSADVEAAGYCGHQSIEVRIISGQDCIGGETLANRLKLPSEKRILLRQRIRYIGPDPDSPATEPESIADSYYPYDLVKDSPLIEPESINTAEILDKLGSPLRNYTDELIPRIATPEESNRLQLPDVTAVLEIVRTTYTNKDKPVIVQHMIRPGQGSRYIYEVRYES
jgi:DNA-binding GntR family transcriptional regulator